MPAFTFTTKEAISKSFDFPRVHINHGIVFQHCHRLCIFEPFCDPVVQKTRDNEILVTGNEGTIGVNSDTRRCSLTKFEIAPDGFFQLARR